MPWFVDEIIDSIKNIPSVVDNLLNEPVTYTRPQPQPVASVIQAAPEPEPVTSWKDPSRGVELTKEEIDAYVRPMLYSEIATINDRAPEKVELEARTVLNTVLNRAKTRGMSVKDVITEPNQYQGIEHPKFKNFATNSDPLEKEQIDFVNQTVDKILLEMQEGTFQDNVTGAPFYGHMTDGTIKAFDTWEEYKKAIDAGLVK